MYEQAIVSSCQKMLLRQDFQIASYHNRAYYDFKVHVIRRARKERLIKQSRKSSQCVARESNNSQQIHARYDDSCCATNYSCCCFFVKGARQSFPIKLNCDELYQSDTTGKGY